MKTMIPLTAWWQRSDDTPVAVNQQSVLLFGEFIEKVAAWVAVLQQHPGQRFALYSEHADEFLAALLALWQCGKTACIPGDNLLATSQSLASQVDGFIGEFPQQSLINRPLHAESPAVAWRELSPSAQLVEVYTSGSSGEPKAIRKTLALLQAEIDALNQLPTPEPVKTVLSTVTHQHLYGFIFRLLRPFCQQVAFTTLLQEYPEDVLAMAARTEGFMLVSSPAHLARMSSQHAWHELQTQCHQVVSSAAPLNRADSLRAGDLLAAPVFEIYGSTETGAMAWRCQQQTIRDATWQAFSHIRMQPSANNGASVTLLASGAVETLSDYLKFTDNGQFILMGRHDRVVKVEGKRLSLSQMENALAENPLVEEAKALLLSRRRVETAVVLRLSARGEALLINKGRKTVIAALKQALQVVFELALLPRRWRFVTEFPVNAQGKTPVNALMMLFDGAAEKWPQVLRQESGPDSLTLECQIPANLAYFDGHFDAQPILPGVVQVHWAAHYGQPLLPAALHFKTLEVLKFQQMLLPEQNVTLTLHYDRQKQKLSFRYQSARGTHSSGRLCYE